MPTALDLPGGEFEIVLECDQELPEGERARWTARALKEGERRRIEDMEASRQAVTPDGNITFTKSQNRVHIEILNFALLKVENFRDKTGVEIEIKREKGRITGDTFARMKNDWIAELAKEIWNRSELTEEQVKN